MESQDSPPVAKAQKFEQRAASIGFVWTKE